MRRIMRKIVEGEADKLGDLSTLSDPSVVDAIIKKVRNHSNPVTSASRADPVEILPFQTQKVPENKDAGKK